VPDVTLVLGRSSNVVGPEPWPVVMLFAERTPQDSSYMGALFVFVGGVEIAAAAVGAVVSVGAPVQPLPPHEATSRAARMTGSRMFMATRCATTPERS
jgi:hypothetical protein